MARRRKGQNDASGGILLLLFMAFAIVVFVLRLVATILFFGLPLALAGAWLVTLRLRGGPPTLPRAEEFNDIEEASKMAELVHQRNALIKYVDEQYRIGDQYSLSLTEGSGGSRFDARSRLGKELNRKLESAESTLAIVSQNVTSLQYQTLQLIPDVNEILERWLHRKAAHDSSAFGITLLIVFSVYSVRFNLFPPAYAYKAASVLLWNPLPQLAEGQLIFASAAAFLMMVFASPIFAFLARREIDTSVTTAWDQVRAKWAKANSFASDLDPAEEEEEEEVVAEPNYEQAAQWSDILRCSPSASPAEVKEAYRRAMKENHPDGVATMSDKLKAVAEEESKRINAAFCEAKRDVGFK